MEKESKDKEMAKEREKMKERWKRMGRKVRKRGKSEGTTEKAMVEGKGPNHQGENKRNGRSERAMVKKIELKRGT